MFVICFSLSLNHLPQVLNHTDEYHVSKLISLALADMFGLPGLPCPKHMSCESGPVLSNGDRKRLANSIIMGAANCLVQIPARKKPIQVCVLRPKVARAGRQIAGGTEAS